MYEPLAQLEQTAQVTSAVAEPATDMNMPLGHVDQGEQTVSAVPSQPPLEKSPDPHTEQVAHMRSDVVVGAAN